MARLVAVTKLNQKKVIHQGRHKTWYVGDDDESNLTVDPSLAVAPENAFPSHIKGCKWLCDKCGRRWPAFSLTHSRTGAVIQQGNQLCPPVGCSDDGCPICLGTGGRHISKSKLKKILAQRSTPKPTPPLVSDWKPHLLPGEFSVEVNWVDYQGIERNNRYHVKSRFDLDEVMSHRWFFPISKSLYAFRSDDLRRHKVRWAVKNSDGSFIKFKELLELVPETPEYLAQKKKDLGLVDTAPYNARSPRLLTVNRPEKDIDSRRAIEIFLEGCDYEIDHTDRVAVIKKSPHQQEFFDRIRQLESIGIPANVVTLFHGTKPQNLASIVSGGFRLPKSKDQSALAFGDGVYFGKWEKATGYAHTSHLSELFSPAKAIKNVWGNYVSLSKDYEEIDKKIARKRERRMRRKYAANEWLADYLENSRFIIECDIILGNVFLPAEVMNQSAMDLVRGSGNKYQSCHYHGTFANAEWIVYDPRQVFIRKIHFYQPPKPKQTWEEDPNWAQTQYSAGYITGMAARNRVDNGKGGRKLRKALNDMLSLPNDDTVAVLAKELEESKEVQKTIVTKAVITNPDLYTEEMKQSLFTDDPLPLQ